MMIFKALGEDSKRLFRLFRQENLVLVCESIGRNCAFDLETRLTVGKNPWMGFLGSFGNGLPIEPAERLRRCEFLSQKCS